MFEIQSILMRVKRNFANEESILVILIIISLAINDIGRIELARFSWQTPSPFASSDLFTDGVGGIPASSIRLKSKLGLVMEDHSMEPRVICSTAGRSVLENIIPPLTCWCFKADFLLVQRKEKKIEREREREETTMGRFWWYNVPVRSQSSWLIRDWSERNGREELGGERALFRESRPDVCCHSNNSVLPSFRISTWLSHISSECPDLFGKRNKFISALGTWWWWWTCWRCWDSSKSSRFTWTVSP